ncbi:hypothetical protein JNB_10254 [Janibacter sp. HTCC2649]|nr:hypothetical protein JNB_10254 [Janibacter sp. HTCC2649]
MERAVERLRRDEHLDAHPRRVDGGRLEDLDLHAATHQADVLVERRREVGLAEADSGNPAACQTIGPLVVDVGRANQLERPRRPATLREVRALEHARPRVDECGVGSRHVGTGHDPRKSRPGIRDITSPALDLDDLELGKVTTIGVGRQDDRVEVLRELANGHTVRLDDLLGAHTRGPRVGHHRPKSLAANGVRAVEHDHGGAGLHARLHRRVHRPDVGVEPRTDVLDVEDDRVDASSANHLRELRGRRAIGVIDRQAGALVDVGVLRLAGLSRAAEAVLGPEDALDVDGTGLVHLVDDRAQVHQDAGGVRDDADLASGQDGPVRGGGDIRTGRHLALGVIHDGGVCRWAGKRCRGTEGEGGGSGEPGPAREELATVGTGHGSLHSSRLVCLTPRQGVGSHTQGQGFQ